MEKKKMNLEKIQRQVWTSYLKDVAAWHLGRRSSDDLHVVVVVYHFTIVAIGHGLLKKFLHFWY